MIGEANSRYECNRRNTFLFAKCSSSRPNAFCTGINDSAIAMRGDYVEKFLMTVAFDKYCRLANLWRTGL